MKKDKNTTAKNSHSVSLDKLKTYTVKWRWNLIDVIKNGSGWGKKAEEYATKSIVEAEDERILEELKKIYAKKNKNI